MPQQITHGAGAQVVRVTPVDLGGKPVRVTAATYGISDLRRGVDDADRIVVAAGTAASLDTFSQATTALAGCAAADPRLVQVASTTGAAAGRRMLITNPAGDRELLTVDSVTSTSVRARVDLTKSYAVGSMLQGVEVSVTFPEAEADDEDALRDGGGPYAIDLVVTGSDRPRQREFAEVVRHRSTTLCSLEDMLELDPQIGSLTGDRVDPHVALRVASRELEVELRLAGIDPGYTHLGDAGRVSCAYLACWHATKGARTAEVQARSELYRERARHMITALIGSKNVVGAAQVSRTTDSAPAPGPTAPSSRGLFSRW